MSESNNTGEVAETRQLAEVGMIHPSNPPSAGIVISRVTDRFIKHLMRWICPDRRVANRHAMPSLIAYLGMIRSSKAYPIRDVSISGFYLLTEDRWIPGTSFPMTLERTDEDGLSLSLTVQVTVTRIGKDGVGFSFVQNAVEGKIKREPSSSTRIDLSRLAQFLKGLPLAESSSHQLERAS